MLITAFKIDFTTEKGITHTINMTEMELKDSDLGKFVIALEEPILEMIKLSGEKS